MCWRVRIPITFFDATALVHVRYLAKEMTNAKGGAVHVVNDPDMPFDTYQCGIYSCHGIEPKFTRNGFQVYGKRAPLLCPSSCCWCCWVGLRLMMCGLTLDARLPPESLNRGLLKVNSDSSPCPLGKTATALSKQVKSKINQDRGGIVYPFGGRRDMAFFCVMDGHGRGGERISEYCMTHLPKLIVAHGELATNPGKALQEAFVEVDHDLRRIMAREATYAGTTCVCVLAVGDRLIIANSGDSRAVVGAVGSDGGCVATDLSFDHKPNRPEEEKRVRAMGGFVSQESDEEGPSRVWLGKAMNSCGLAMARSLGDHALAAVGVIAEPEITMHALRPEDRYLILGSDGIWEFIESQQAADLVHGVIGAKGTADKACRTLIEKSSVAWKLNEGDYRDDITGIVVTLPCFESQFVRAMTPKTDQKIKATAAAGTKF